MQYFWGISWGIRAPGKGPNWIVPPPGAPKMMPIFPKGDGPEKIPIGVWGRGTGPVAAIPGGWGMGSSSKFGGGPSIAPPENGQLLEGFTSLVAQAWQYGWGCLHSGRMICSLGRCVWHTVHTKLSGSFSWAPPLCSAWSIWRISSCEMCPDNFLFFFYGVR